MIKLKLPVSVKKPNFKNKKFWAVLLIIVIAAGGWASFNKYNSKGKVYAQVAGHKIYKEDVQALIGTNQGISEHDAAKVLADKYLAEALAKEQGIKVNGNDVQMQYGKLADKYKKSNEYLYQYQVNQVYFSKLKAHNRGVYKGKFLITNFSRYIKFEQSLPEDDGGSSKYGNPNAIAKDRKYAKDLIDRLYNDITSGKITFDQAIKIENDDPVLGKKAYSSLPHSGSFDTSKELNGTLWAASIRQRVNNLKAGETTKPFVVRVANSTDAKTTVESYFLVVRMDETSGSYSGMDFKDYLEQSQQRLGYKVNV